MLHIWSEFNMLALKYNAINLAHGTPGMNPPEFLIENMVKAVEGEHNQYTAVIGHPELRESIVRFLYSKYPFLWYLNPFFRLTITLQGLNRQSIES